jgi:hypothetical protein
MVTLLDFVPIPHSIAVNTGDRHPANLIADKDGAGINPTLSRSSSKS